MARSAVTRVVEGQEMLLMNQSSESTLSDTHPLVSSTSLLGIMLLYKPFHHVAPKAFCFL